MIQRKVAIKKHAELVSLVKRFFDKVEICREDKRWCWIWTSALDQNGYGLFWFNGRSVYAHRFMYEISIGKIPEGMDVLHVCDTRNCVNPRHFFVGTQTDNNADMYRKGRVSYGERSGRAKLTDRVVAQIRRMWCLGMTQKDIAGIFGVDSTTIWSVVHRKTWRRVS